MKRILFLTLMLLTATMSTWADHWKLSHPDEGQQGSTTVYAKLKLNPVPTDYSAYELAAFIGDEVRAVAHYGTKNPSVFSFDDYNYWLFDVKGYFTGTDADNGKAITFKLYNANMAAEYELTPSESITFSAVGKYGEPSNLIELSAVEWTLNPRDATLQCNVGDDISAIISDYYEILPADADLTAPAVSYSIDDTPNATGTLVQNGTALTATGRGTAYVKVFLTDNTSVWTEVNVNIHNWVSDGSAKPTTIEATYRSGTFSIADEVLAALHFTPELGSENCEGFYNGELSVTSSNEEVVFGKVGYGNGQIGGDIEVRGAGTAVLTFTWSYPDYLNTAYGAETQVTQKSFQLTVNVKQGVTSLDVPKILTVNKGDQFDLTTVITPWPENADFDATKITYTYDNTKLTIANNILTGKVTSADGYEVIVGYSELPNFSMPMKVRVLNKVTAINVNPATIKVKKDDWEDLQSKLADAVSFTPADHTDQIEWTPANTDIVGYETGYTDDNNGVLYPKASGTTTLTITAYDYDDSGLKQTHATNTITVNVVEGVTNFQADIPTEMAVGGTYQITLTPEPAGADVDLDLLQIKVWTEKLPDGWNYVTMGNPELQADGTITISLTPTEPGLGSLMAVYDIDGTDPIWIKKAGEVNVGVPMTLNKDWQWRTLWGPIESFEDYFGREGILEVRSQNALMARDSEIGYFGDLYEQGLASNVAYKIKATDAIAQADARLLQGGTYLDESLEVSLLKGWTWIPNPYYHFMTFDQLALKGNEGDRIVSKEGGFVEFSGGAWTGTLKGLEPWQAYLYYNSGDAASSLIYPAETDVYQPGNNGGDVSGPTVGSARRKVNAQEVWQYDPQPYRDNMSIVAQLDGIAVPEHYSVGAFVDGECRGEGQCIDGRMFITVHANQGEQITFLLRNELTGELFPVDQTVRMQLMMGSMKSPLRLTADAVVTGVKDIEHSTLNIDHSALNIERYDLGGRRVANVQKGISVQRSQNGTVKKVVK